MPREAAAPNGRGGKRAPANALDRYSVVLRAAQIRHVHAVRNNKNSQYSWQKAVQYLQESKSDIWVQATGEKKGICHGLPSSIQKSVFEQLLEIIHRREDVEEWALRYPAGEGGGGGAAGLGGAGGQLGIKDNVIYKNAKYRNSSYALLASLWKVREMVVQP